MGKWSRRAFISVGLLSGGAIVLGVAIRPGNRATKVKELVGGKDDFVLNVWVKIGRNNSITIIVPHAEMGQGTHTTLAMMLADEMDADWNNVKVMEAPAEKEYANYALAKGFILGENKLPSFLTDTINGSFLAITKQMAIQTTGGSSSVRFTGMYAMRLAGASVKAVLLEAAANKWGVPLLELKAANSYIYHEKSNQKEPYVHFASDALELHQSVSPKLKTPDKYTIMGTSPKRLDSFSKVNGTAKFGIDIQLPNMKYATIKASPVFGSKLQSVEDNGILSQKGILKLVRLENAVAVIADGYWPAKNALNKVKMVFEESSNDRINDQAIYDKYDLQLAKAIEDGDEIEDYKIGNARKVLKEGGNILEAEYKVPFLAHATMEPMNCTAYVHDGICELWLGCQNPLGFAKSVAESLDMDMEKVKVYNQYLGGGFGRRIVPDVAVQAALIAKEVDFPVKLIWSREEDITQDHYREANRSRFKALMDDDGLVKAWENQFLFKNEPEEAPHIPYDIENQWIHYTKTETHIPWGYWRSVDSSMHGFFTESFMDELAFRSNRDPYIFRREHLQSRPRFLKVLDLVAEKADWKTALPDNWGRGISIHKSFGTIVAQVVELELIEAKVKVHRVVCVADPGYAFFPDGFRAQMESGIVFGLTAALYGEIKIENGAVIQRNFHDYEMLRIDECPKIETHIITSDNFPGGAGEPSTPGIAPALTNAIFNATGLRIRELPVKRHNLRQQNKLIG